VRFVRSTLGNGHHGRPPLGPFGAKSWRAYYRLRCPSRRASGRSCCHAKL